MSKAICTICHYLYDSRLGFPESGIPAGTPFWTADDSLFACPQCGWSKDIFIEVEESIVEVEDPSDLTEIESCHVPRYTVEDDVVRVTVGQDDSEHPQEREHMIEWIEVRDGNGESIDRVYFGENDDVEAVFSIDTDEEFEVLASCSEHGIWKWIPHESTNL